MRRSRVKVSNFLEEIQASTEGTHKVSDFSERDGGKVALQLVHGLSAHDLQAKKDGRKRRKKIKFWDSFNSQNAKKKGLDLGRD